MSSSSISSIIGWRPDWKQPYKSSPQKPHISTIFLSDQTATRLNQNLNSKRFMNHMWENDKVGKSTAVQSLTKKLSISLKEMPSLISHLKGKGWIRTFKGAGGNIRRYIGPQSFKAIYELTTLGKKMGEKIFSSIPSSVK